MKKLLLAVVLVAAVAAAKNPVVRFAVLGDRTGGHVEGVYEQVVTEVARLRPELVFTVGDQIEGYTEDSVKLGEEWREYVGIVAGLGAPLHLVPGNHDITTDAQLPAYESYVGKPYRSLDYQGLHFVILDVSRWEAADKLPAEQLAWLEKDLRQGQRARYTIVFFHKPFWDQSVANRKPDTLHSLFVKYGVDAVFSGHYHEYFSATYDGIRYTAVGSSGGETEPGPTGIQYQFVWVMVDDTGIHIAPIDKGAVRASDDVTVKDRRQISANYMQGIGMTRPVMLREDMTAQESVTVVVTNTGSEPVEDTLRWSAVEGWTVEPASQTVSIGPGAGAEFRFRAKCTGKAYPAPEASVRLPYAAGKKSPVTKSLRVARTAHCTRAAAEPDIDGQVDEKCWAKPVMRFIDSEGNAAKTDSSRFYFSHDDASLYLAAILYDPAVNTIKAQANETDGPVHKDDCAGFFLQPDTAQPVIYQVYFNPAGTVLDQKIVVSADGGTDADMKWNGQYEVKTARGSGFWSVEAGIPLEQWQASAEQGTVWGLNFRRKQPGRKANADWQPVSYDPGNLGRLVME